MKQWLKRNNVEELSRFKISFSWIVISLHWNDSFFFYKYSISLNNSNVKTNGNVYVIIYTNCLNTVIILRLRIFKSLQIYAEKGDFLFCF